MSSILIHLKNLFKILFLIFLLTPLFVAAQTKETNEMFVCDPQIFTLTGDTTYCAGTGGVSITLDTSQTGISYQLYKDGTVEGLAVAGTGNSLLWNNLLTGTYTVIAANDTNQACTSLMNGSIHVLENPLPVVNAGPDQVAICWEFVSLNATASGGSGSYIYHWEPSNMVVYPDTQTATTIPLGGAVQYTVLVKDSATSCVQSDTINVYAMCSFSVGTLVQPNNVCLGDTVFLNTSTPGYVGSGTYNYTWSSIPSGFTANVRDTFDIPNVNTTYTVWVDDVNYHVWASADAPVVVNRPPEIFTLSGGGTYCTGTGGLTVTLSGSETGVHYQLFKNGIAYGVHLTGSGNSLFWSNLYPGIYKVVGTSSCFSINMSGNIAIVDNPIPLIDAGADQSTYYGGSVQLNATVAGGSGSFTYQWQPAARVVDPNALNTSTMPLPSCTQFILYVTDMVSLCSYSDTVNVIGPFCGVFSASAVAQPSVCCIGDTVQLHALTSTFGLGNYSYMWSSVPPGFSSSSPSPFATPEVNTTYTVVVNDGTQSLTQSVSVTINSSLNYYYINSPGFYCMGESGTYIITTGSETGVVYQLFKNDTAIGLPKWGTGNSLIWNSLYSGLYNMLAIDSSLQHCNYYFTDDFGIINSHPPLVDLGVDTFLCLNQNITLMGPSGSGLSYLWTKYLGDTLSYTQSLYLDTTVNGTGPTTYILTVSNSNNCIDADTINVWFVTCTLVDEYKDSEIKIFPNPATDKILIKTENQNVDKIELFSAYGELLLSTDITDAVNISHLTVGIYIIKVFFKDAYRIHKLVKIKPSLK